MPVFQNKGNYLFVEAIEPYSLKFLISMIHELNAHCQKGGLDQALVDLRNMEGEMSIMDRYDVGVEVAKVLGSRIKVAAVAQPSRINFMVETVAVNRGAKLKVFVDIEKAMEWLEVR